MAPILKVYCDGFVMYTLASGESIIAIDPALQAIIERTLRDQTRDDVVDGAPLWIDPSPSGATSRHALIPSEHLPYPWCIGAPTKAECARLGYCRRQPTCGD